MPTSTDSITATIVDAFGFLADAGFRHFKSYRHFRRKDLSGFSYVTINVTTRNRGSHSFAFYVGTRVDPLESIIKHLLDDDTKLDHWSRSTNTYTVNIGPGSTNWDHSVRGNWSFQSDADVDAAIPAVSSFLGETMLPFLGANTSAEAVRQTLLDTPGRTQNLMPHHQVFGADVLLGNTDRLVADHQFLDERYRRWIASHRTDIDDFYGLCRAHLTASSA